MRQELGVEVRGLEYYVQGEDDHCELIVNTTDEAWLAIVMLELKHLGWSWEFVEVQIVPPEDDEEGPTEWTRLIGARKAHQLKEVA